MPGRTLLVMIFYENKGNAAAVFLEFPRLEDLHKRSFLPQGLGRMIARFVKTGNLGVQSDRGRKPV